MQFQRRPKKSIDEQETHDPGLEVQQWIVDIKLLSDLGGGVGYIMQLDFSLHLSLIDGNAYCLAKY